MLSKGVEFPGSDLQTFLTSCARKPKSLKGPEISQGYRDFDDLISHLKSIFIHFICCALIK